MVDVPEECLVRWTSADVQRMVEIGLVERPERVELVEGMVLDKMSQKEPHAVALSFTARALSAVFAGVAEIKAGVPLFLSDTSEPEPDVMVTALNLRRGTRAEDVLLLIEVSDTSLRKDQTLEAVLYARYGIPEYASST